MPRAMSVAESQEPDAKIVGWMIFCPACQCGHLFYVNYAGKPTWTFNGDVEKPTFSPSMLVFASPKSIPEENGFDQKRCHSFVRDGQIEFLTDCEHELAGKTVPLEDC